MRSQSRPAALAAALVIAAACAPKHPVVYPDERVRTDPAVAQADIEDCEQRADEHGYPQEDPETKVAKQAAGASIAGAIWGALVGWIFGNPGRGAAAGATSAATGAVVRGVRTAGDPDPMRRRFIEICLREKGYQILGWE